MGLCQNKKILHSKRNHKQNKKLPTEWEKEFTNEIFDKDFHLAIKKDEFVPFETTGIDLKGIIQSEKSQTEKNTT